MWMHDPSPCPECKQLDQVEETDKTGLTSDQAGCRWCCMRCNLVFGHPDEPAPLPTQFALGAQACREMMARFVEHGGDPVTAASIRANWNPSWGPDPGRPIL